MKLLFINGPNINMLGIREKDIYGKESYDDLLRYIDSFCRELGIEQESWQSNHEGEIVERIQQAYGAFDGIVINPAAYTHTSVAILDALKAVNIPAVEVHITDVDSREAFRKVSYIRSACVDVYSGFGFKGYELAARRLFEMFGGEGER